MLKRSHNKRSINSNQTQQFFHHNRQQHRQMKIISEIHLSSIELWKVLIEMHTKTKPKKPIKTKTKHLICQKTNNSNFEEQNKNTRKHLRRSLIYQLNLENQRLYLFQWLINKIKTLAWTWFDYQMHYLRFTQFDWGLTKPDFRSTFLFFFGFKLVILASECICWIKKKKKRNRLKQQQNIDDSESNCASLSYATWYLYDDEFKKNIRKKRKKKICTFECTKSGKKMSNI